MPNKPPIPLPLDHPARQRPRRGKYTGGLTQMPMPVGNDVAYLLASILLTNPRLDREMQDAVRDALTNRQRRRESDPAPVVIISPAMDAYALSQLVTFHGVTLDLLHENGLLLDHSQQSSAPAEDGKTVDINLANLVAQLNTKQVSDLLQMAETARDGQRVSRGASRG